MPKNLLLPPSPEAYNIHVWSYAPLPDKAIPTNPVEETKVRGVPSPDIGLTVPIPTSPPTITTFDST
jgi:hypothetical protein